MSIEEQRCLSAAEGWLELGDWESAWKELETVRDHDKRAQPRILKLRWRIYAAAGKWGNAYIAAEGLTRLQPADVEGFVWRSYSARRMEGGNVITAYELLRDAAGDFPDEPIVPFNLACYCCVAERVTEAREWWRRALASAERSGTLKEWKRLGIEEPDLRALWT